ncbi:MAG TPA: YqgE/AlgH family protein [Opitutaceae bacterium]|jgi:putative transcriptional regulator|nr:YqgE/AlgH family protein [Opitutaceae bacterium]
MRERRPQSKNSLAGSLLLAHPGLRDPNFRRTVILMTEDNAGGSRGVVLNRPLSRSLGSLGGDFALGPLADTPLFSGGPVETKQLILAAWQAQPHGFQLHLGVEPERAASLASEPDTHVRAYFGYAGWSPGQLKKELTQSAWLVTDAPRDLFAQPGDLRLWRTTLAREGDEWRLMADEPDSPEHN